ncbi:S8 family peptidase [Geodermatophilus nigrescens]
MAALEPYPHAPADLRDDEQIRTQRDVVRRQIAAWEAALQDDAARRKQQVAAAEDLRDRRCGLAMTQLLLHDDEFPVDPDRVLVRSGDADQATRDLRGLGAGYAPHPVPVRSPRLPDLRVLQDVCAGPRRTAQAYSSAALRLCGATAQPSYAVMLGAIRKAVGGPELSGPPEGGRWSRPGQEVRGPRVVVIDNGLSAEQRADGWLQGLARTDNLDLLDVVPRDEFLDRGAGHGTFVCGIVQQVAPGADLDVRRALDTEGVGEDVEVGEHIVRAAEDGAEVVNLSLGLVTPDGEPPFALLDAVGEAIEIARRRGTHLLLVCAAGNGGDDRPCWPAALSGRSYFPEHVVSVAALRLDYRDETQVIDARWSTRGDWVTCSTLGQGVVSTYVMGTESREYDPQGPETFGADAWATWSGTSFAAPQVTGAIVRLMQEHPEVSTAKEACDRLMGHGRRLFPGYGVSVRILPV